MLKKAQKCKIEALLEEFFKETIYFISDYFRIKVMSPNHFSLYSLFVFFHQYF